MPDILFGVSSTHEPSEWFGRVHTLIVHELGEPSGLDGLRPIEDHELIHSLLCPSEERLICGNGPKEVVFTCDAAFQEQDGDLAFSLKYSGTEIKEPGTYLVQGWGRKHVHWELGAEYDGGIAVVEGEDDTG